MRSSPGCWEAFGLLQADEIGRFGYPDAHGLVVDCFAASHGGDGSDRRDRQSVALHLIALCAVLENDFPPPRRRALLNQLGEHRLDWPELSRPAGFPALDLSSLEGASGETDYETRAHRWAEAVWNWWEPEHDRVRAWVADPPGR